MEEINFPNTNWEFSINRETPVEILHPSGMKFVSMINLNREDRLDGKNSHRYNLNEKDSFLLSYLIDYFLTKSQKFKLNKNQAMVLSANIFCSYRFRIPLEKGSFSNEIISNKDFRKFGEHFVYQVNSSEKLDVFIIGKASNKNLYCVSLQAQGTISKFELIELPRDYFYR